MMIWLLALATASVSAAAAYDFRGAELGMTLEAWRSLAPPPQLMGPARPHCSDEPGSRLRPPLSPGEASLGAVSCIYTDAPQYAARVNQRIGAHEITGATYRFLDGRLYGIDLVAEAGALDDIVAGLEAKFGPAGSVREANGLTGLGISVPGVEMIWEAGGQQIVVTAPAVRIDRMTVNFIDLDAARKIRAADNLADPARSAM